MKIKSSPANQGSVLVIALVVGVILLITLTSFLALVSDENRAVGRAQSWNSAMPVAEAGVEEALTQLQYAGGVANLASNGWTLGSDGMYHKSRSLNSSTHFAVAIQPLTQPVIWSTGYISAPFGSAYVGRLIKVVAAAQSSFGQGITAKGIIRFSGGKLSSYTVTNGVYDTVPGDQFIAMTDTNVSGAINMSGSAEIFGYANTGPGVTSGSSSTLSISGGAVGTTNYIDAGGTGIQAGHYSDNANFQFNDNNAPSWGSYNSGFTAVGTTNIAGSPGTTSYYVVSTISSSGSSKPLLVYGNVSIYVTSTSGNNAIVVSGSGFIDIEPNSSLTIYTAGGVTVSGGGIVNGTGLTKNLTIYGLPTCSTITYSGSANFVGVVDAPEADFTFSGGEDAIGAFVVNTATVSGGSSVHWDSSLGANGGYVVNNWNEMSMNQQ